MLRQTRLGICLRLKRRVNVQNIHFLLTRRTRGQSSLETPKSPSPPQDSQVELCVHICQAQDIRNCLLAETRLEERGLREHVIVGLSSTSSPEIMVESHGRHKFGHVRGM